MPKIVHLHPLDTRADKDAAIQRHGHRIAWETPRIIGIPGGNVSMYGKLGKRMG